MVWGRFNLVTFIELFLVAVQSLSHVRLFATPWTVAHQDPLSMGLSRQEYWSGLSCPPPGDLPNPGMGPVSFMFPTLAGGFFTTSATWEVDITTDRILQKVQTQRRYVTFQ